MRSENIVTLTMNPAIDMGVSVKHMMTDHKMRCLKTRRDPGGGGINVARCLKRFGADPLAIFPMGGASGHMLERLVAAENVRHQSFMIERDCRANFTAVEMDSGEQYRFVLPGPTLGEEEWNAGLGLMTQASSSGYAVASGSLPRGVPHDFYARLARNLSVLGGAKLVLDTSGPPLKHALDLGVFLVKPSLSEFSDLLDEKNPDLQACLAAGRTLVVNGKAEIVALTMGAEGAMLITRDVALYAKPPPVTVRGTVGAGDSFLALLILCIARKLTLPEAFRQAVAAGCGALLSPGTGLCTPSVVAELAGQVNIVSLE
ncbi:MAG: 1-phosphofructokinase family hexose kinase [Alphaproteobacteria bacterium]|nr:1-phosphofructokinase family hexose kinase [Alphaproteobacteria bacterium]MDE1986815.1 1-phosphofructokinase family hexose kinase [Alphaproteobacteria bacterium]MDE2163710.1 1-phosphofructokinase family hexose kinase [Alphaproteobacteria bacterium]MDE2265975.1 1-phosphofructokinase family hexose kinase [Alphaproteobacteria bacterium]MDE2500301.1 1-phosphofructokinase family hexose kinase [Alphaproteobacteria bacterium]